MPNLDQEMKARVAADNALRAQEEKNKDAAAKRERYEEFQRLEALMRLPEVKWLQEQYQMRVDLEREAALSVTLSDDEANKARHRHSVAKALCDLLPDRYAELKNEVFAEEPKEIPLTAVT